MKTLSQQRRSLGQIEAQLDQDRAALASSMASLRGEMDVNTGDGLGNLRLRARAKAFVDTVGATVAANPVAVGLTAVGIAWLAFGGRRAGKKVSLAGTTLEAMDRWADDGGPVPEAEPWIAEADRIRHRASGLQASISRALRDRTAPEGELTRHREDVLVALTSDVRRALHHGLEGLTQSARETAVAAREAAYIARVNAAEASAQTVRARPFASGAILAVAGAAAAWILPQPQGEVRLLKAAARRAKVAGLYVLDAEARHFGNVAITLAGALINDLKRQVDATARETQSPDAASARPARAS